MYVDVLVTVCVYTCCVWMYVCQCVKDRVRVYVWCVYVWVYVDVLVTARVHVL